VPGEGERRRPARRTKAARRETDSRGVQLAMVLHFARRMAPAVMVVVAYTMVAAALVRFDMLRVGEKTFDYGEALYAMYTQLFFEPTESLPQAPLARFLFWITPLAGFVLIAEGLYKVGATLLDEGARREVWVRVMSERMEGHVVVVGLGHVGYRVVQELRDGGSAIVAIERREEDSFVETVRAMGIPVHVGDARRDELLEQAGIARAAAVVCTTDDDLANLEVALDAKRMNPQIRVVMRMFDQRLAAKVGGALDLDQTFSTSAVTAPLVALQATQKGIRAAYRTGDGAARVVAEVTVGASFDPTEVAELEEKIEGRIVGLRHAGAEAFKAPRSSTRVLAGDVVVVDAQPSDLPWIRKKLRAG
jgi:voltage-gated potassium channel